MSNHKNKLLMWFMALAVILACVPTLNAAPAIPTLDPLMIDTYIAQTVSVASTRTAAALPSLTPTSTSTPTPTNTETEEPTATNTVIFILSSPTPFVVATNTITGGATSNKDYDCTVISVSPANGTIFNPRADFDAKWRVKNIGKKNWDRGSADYIYDSGDKFYKVAGYDFNKTVKVGETVDLFVDMQAPKNDGTYSTNWVIRIGSQKFCKMSLTIVVK